MRQWYLRDNRDNRRWPNLKAAVYFFVIIRIEWSPQV